MPLGSQKEGYYTESMGFYSAHRLKRFGLDGVIDVLFSPEDHDLPAGVSLDKLRRLPDEYYELQVTQVRHTPPGELKPNPRVLLDIIQAVGATIDRCAYVGDSLFKDVAMARDIGVFDIHAKYGTSQQKPDTPCSRKFRTGRRQMFNARERSPQRDILSNRVRCSRKRSPRSSFIAIFSRSHRRRRRIPTQMKSKTASRFGKRRSTFNNISTTSKCGLGTSR
ncbi:HAD hydrolase-like protein [Sinorhizobium meliloti]|nr:HAD hydrolase-like protein [Sinorhizobium meliloti]